MKNSNENDNFLNRIKLQQDPDMKILLKIQDEIEKRGINKENIKILTQNLSAEQKIKLENLYKNQIDKYEKNIENYKNKIIAIRKQVI